MVVPRGCAVCAAASLGLGCGAWLVPWETSTALSTAFSATSRAQQQISAMQATTGLKTMAAVTHGQQHEI